MSQVLYRKYRSQNFSEVVGQEVIKITLQNAVSSGSVAHAYLFTGPRGVGKTSLARILAKALNCTDLKEGQPCIKCENCEAVANGRFLDLIEIDAASHTGVDNIREIIEHVKFSPSKGKFKVIVIDEVHMLSKGAFNALLKTLEEPPAHAIFILATTEVGKVPATIISRTQRFDFKRISQADIVEHLKKVGKSEKLKVSDEVLKLIARAAEGSMRDGLSIYDQIISFSGGKVTKELAEEILGLPPFHLNQDFLQLLSERHLGLALKFIKDLSINGRDLSGFGNMFLEYLEKLLSYKIENNSAEVWGLTPEDLEKLVEQSRSVSIKDLIRLINLFLEAVPKVKYSTIPELPLELAVIEFLEDDETKRFGDGEKKTTEVTGKVTDLVAKKRPVTKENHFASEPVEEKIVVEDLKKTEESGPAKPITANLSKIMEKWNHFISEVSKHNHSLVSSLQLCNQESCKDGTLTLSFPYRFHKDAVEQRKNKDTVEKVLEQVYGGRIKLRCLVTAEVGSEPEEKKVDGGLIDEALKVFGA
ncbi:MAG: hypothetical protein COT91_00295 [Candidatus Doudnabacteria bacterium CG10_big_fil_rev_8_21_14_0_10_41_10]|uniref:DNA polymerase III subunit gamma/tau n=1 Tax=Candidatus Doudnabacteria bacterium CG10_big_fil_rev_8_21_14_0_10_41_10 TaxID=1974551 RepID=A0A2H0VH77_9BACT|nr:MAG: hypothetical protein COT91_00295 [Candidatus Doudnabacteria bacterium CG10_big_fil_rev_8_21_14_0_10_41_10]